MKTTTDLSEFGYRELNELEIILKAWRTHGLPKDFNNDEVVPMFNMHSGYVFLTNGDYQVAMESSGKLYSFYSCPECGEEGSIEEIENHSNDKNCKEYLESIKEATK